MIKDSVLREIFESKGNEVEGKWKEYVTRSFMICSPHQIAVR
jgi:hypothetical protein